MTPARSTAAIIVDAWWTKRRGSAAIGRRQRLGLRLMPAPDADTERAWRDATAGMARQLKEHGLEEVAVDWYAKLPEQSPGGKFRAVIPLQTKRTGGEH